MAGHSKFANIMHRKGAQDKRRAQLFTKLAREISAAVSVGGPEPDNNHRLARAIVAARAQSLPKENIQRAIDKASGAGGEKLEQVRYEGFGPGGVGVIVETLTDNRNRTASEVRSFFTKCGGTLGETNSVSFMFSRKGVLTYPLKAASADQMFEAALEAGAENVETGEESHEILTTVEDFAAVRDALAQKFGDASGAKLQWRPINTVPVAAEPAESLFKLLELLEDSDDVQTVFANYEVADDVLQRLAS